MAPEVKPHALRSAAAPRVGPVEPPPQEFVAAQRRLDQESTAIARDLRSTLLAAYELHDLTRREVQTAQREIERLARSGLLPKPAAYWSDVAVPRASLLVDGAMGAVNGAGAGLADHVDRFLTATSRSTLEPWISSADGLAQLQVTANQAIDRVLEVIPDDEGINQIGEWWQRGLRRAATTRAIPKLLVSPEPADVVIGTAELSLLDQAPWCYGDRLLSAFELAHSEIRTRARGLTDEIRLDVRQRAHGGVVSTGAGGKVTIDMRHPALG
jgi:hypothetical protein